LIKYVPLPRAGEKYTLTDFADLSTEGFSATSERKIVLIIIIWFECVRLPSCNSTARVPYNRLSSNKLSFYAMQTTSRDDV
jgi:hypothetical protein